MSVSLRSVLDDAPEEVDELDSIGGTPSQLPTKEFYCNNLDSLRQMRVRELPESAILGRRTWCSSGCLGEHFRFYVSGHQLVVSS